MEYFWKENKKFVGAVAGAFVFFLLYNGFVLGPLRGAAAQAAKSRLNEKRDLEDRMKKGVPTAESLAAARIDKQKSAGQLAKLGPQVAFAVGDKFQKPKKENVKSFYDDLKLDLQKKLQEKAVGGKVAFPASLGFPEDINEETSTEVLSRLAVVERLVTVAVDSEVDKIDVIDAQHGMDRDERSSKKSQFLTKYSVFMKVVGKSESIFRLVHGVQKEEAFLAVTQFDMARSDPTKDSFEVSIGVALLKVDDKAGMETK
jgi:hypothetical protein